MTTETTTAAADVSVESAGKTLDTSNIAAQVFRVVGGDAAGDASAATAIEWTCDGEYLRVDAWGANSVRVRSRLMQRPLDTDWALLPPAAGAPAPSVTVNATGAVLVNGEITVRLDLFGWQKDQLRLTFENTRTGKVLLREASDGGALRLRARAHHPLESGAESPVASFEPPAGEHLYGMGEYQQNVLDLKGSTLELAHRFSHERVSACAASYLAL